MPPEEHPRPEVDADTRIDRRRFLQSSIGAAGLVALAYSCCQPTRQKTSDILASPDAASLEQNAHRDINEAPITHRDISFIDDGLTMRVRHRDFRIQSLQIHDQEFSVDTLKWISGPEGIAASFVGADLVLRSSSGDIFIDRDHLLIIATGLCEGKRTHQTPFRVEHAKGTLLLYTMMLGSTGDCQLSFQELLPAVSPLEVA